MTAIRTMTIAAKDEVFDVLFDASTRVAALRDEAAKAEYQRLDERLRERIAAVASRLYEPSFVESPLEVIWDWWPNHTRYLEASIDALSQALLDGLRELLVDEFQDWRIQVVVYGDPLDGRTMVGSIVIWAEEILISRALYALLKWRGLDFRCESEPIWRQSAGSHGPR